MPMSAQVQGEACARQSVFSPGNKQAQYHSPPSPSLPRANPGRALIWVKVLTGKKGLGEQTPIVVTTAKYFAPTLNI